MDGVPAAGIINAAKYSRQSTFFKLMLNCSSGEVTRNYLPADEKCAPVSLQHTRKTLEVDLRHSGGNEWSAPIAGHRTEEGIGKMRKCVTRNAESKMRNAKCGMHVRNGV